ncbi:MAG: hypothetical protein APF77_07305 [Clostridia bacterium BRH_c25]|nr:MAG: hypothetical protein APF77_07305 [Clostridia bacterium BRH_c25]
MYKKQVIVANKTGLHARPASEFVKLASSFESNIFINNKGRDINAKSVIGVLSAGVCANTAITIFAEGADEIDAVEALTQLIESKFGE